MAPPPFPDDVHVASIPRISFAGLTAGDLNESTKMFDACCEQGFFLLDLNDSKTGRELLEHVDRSFQLGEEFFALDQQTKENFKLSSGNLGYKPIGLIKLKDGTGDLTELCALGRDSIMDYKAMSIPQVFQRERAPLQDTVKQIHSVALLLLRAFASHLDIPFSSFESMHQSDSPSSTQLRFLHYPPQGNPSTTKGKQQSLMGHTDSGSLTILFTKIGGLQILPADADEADESAWQWVRPEPGCAIINIGDPLVQWTGGILRSAFHRVLYAPGEQAGEERYSFGYFLKPADEAPMDCFQLGEVIPRPEEGNVTGEMPPYKLWHQDKSRKIMQGHQEGVFRGGVGRPVRNGTIAA